MSNKPLVKYRQNQKHSCIRVYIYI